MATSALISFSPPSLQKPHFKTSNQTSSTFLNRHRNPLQNPTSFPFLRSRNPIFLNPSHSTCLKASFPNKILSSTDEEIENLVSFSDDKPGKVVFWVLFWASLSIAWFAASSDANAAVDSIKASGFGLKIASALRGSGLPDEAVVFCLATLPVIELRGAIPVGYWMQLNPTLLTVLSVLGNMVPIPFIILYLKKFASFLTARNETASNVLNMLFESAKKKAGPIQEFQWLGLMLFVAVPFPGTGAWTGGIIASVLDMPFWPAVSANFLGVVLAGLLVNLLVNLGLKYAIVVGVILFFVSSYMWSILRSIVKSFKSSS